MCAVMNITEVALVGACKVSQTKASSFEWYWTVIVNVDEGSYIPRVELSTVHL
jgi:hypothetical protein